MARVVSTAKDRCLVHPQVVGAVSCKLRRSPHCSIVGSDGSGGTSGFCLVSSGVPVCSYGWCVAAERWGCVLWILCPGRGAVAGLLG